VLLIAPAHTDIYVHFQKAGVIQMADLFFKIDTSRVGVRLHSGYWCQHRH